MTISAAVYNLDSSHRRVLGSDARAGVTNLSDEAPVTRSRFPSFGRGGHCAWQTIEWSEVAKVAEISILGRHIDGRLSCEVR